MKLTDLLTESRLNENNPKLNKKVKAFLDGYLSGISPSDPDFHHTIATILKGALGDANFHSEAKKVDSLFPKAKKSEHYKNSTMNNVIEDKGVDIAKWAKWDGKEIAAAIGFYVSMTIGRPVGEKVESLVESAGMKLFKESVNEGPEPQIKKVAQLTGARVDAVEKYVSSRALNITKLLKYLKDEKYKGAMDFIKAVLGDKKQDAYFIKMFKESVVNEGKYDGMLDVIEDLVSKASSFMDVGNQLKKHKVKYSFSTSMMPIYRLDKLPIVIVNKKYVNKADREVGDIAIGLMESIKESVVNEGGVYFSKELKNGNTFQVLDRDTKGMRGTQDKFHMQVVDKKGNVVSDLGSHTSIAGAKKYSKQVESVVNEASDVETYHKTFTSAAEAAEAMVKKRGFEVDKDDWSSQVAMGGKYTRSRPSVGKTNSFTVGLTKGGKPQRKALQFSVYGMASGKFELTAYIN
tara:strand:+ start:8926 stop:10311 length:1386 start_codon:yes stop_codon:yes gene_type:complete